MPRKSIVFSALLSLVLFLALAGCASGPEIETVSTNAAIIRVLRGSRQSLEFEAEMFSSINTLHPRPGESLEVVFQDRQTARVEVLSYDENSGFIRFVLTEEGFRANFSDYIVGGAYLQLQPDPNAVRQTGGAGAIDS